MKIFHLGYAEFDSLMRLAAIMQADPTALIIDTRFAPYSWRKGWNKDDKCHLGMKPVSGWRKGDPVPDGAELIKGLVSRWGKRYRWAGTVLGNRNFNNGGPISIVDLTVGIQKLRAYIESGYTPVLICECDVLESCHRRLILKALKYYLPEIEVLDADGNVSPLTGELPAPSPFPTMPSLKAWSICPPYPQIMIRGAQLLAAGIPPKEIENRDYPVRHHGPVLLHSSKTFLEDDLETWCIRFPALREILPSSYDLGYIVGIGTMNGIVSACDDPWFCGDYGMVIENIMPLSTPVKWRGQPKLFDVPYTAVCEYLPEQYRLLKVRVN